MNRERENRIIFWLFLAPVLFAFIMIIVIPFFLGVFYSFTNWSSSARVDNALRFVGFENFTNSFKDPTFLYSFLITTLYTVINVIAINVIALALALVVTSRLKFKNIYSPSYSSRLIWVNRMDISNGNIAKTADSCADISQNHERDVTLFPTFTFVGTGR